MSCFWRKSSYSAPNGNCVEISETPDLVSVRDSKHRDGPVLQFSLDEWAAFVDGVRFPAAARTGTGPQPGTVSRLRPAPPMTYG